MIGTKFGPDTNYLRWECAKKSKPVKTSLSSSPTSPSPQESQTLLNEDPEPTIGPIFVCMGIGHISGSVQPSTDEPYSCPKKPQGIPRMDAGKLGCGLPTAVDDEEARQHCMNPQARHRHRDIWQGRTHWSTRRSLRTYICTRKVPPLGVGLDPHWYPARGITSLSPGKFKEWKHYSPHLTKLCRRNWWLLKPSTPTSASTKRLALWK